MQKLPYLFVMTEAWLQIDATQAARLTFKGLAASRGVGVGQLRFDVELAAQKAVAAGQAVWLTGTVEVRNLGAASGHLGVLRTQIQPIALPDLGGTRKTSFTCDVGYPQLQVIENHRAASLSLFLDFSGFWLIDGKPTPFWNCQFEIEVQQSDWIAVLENTGFRRILLLEFDAPETGQT